MHALRQTVIATMLMVALSIMALTSGALAKKPLTFTPIDVPGATETFAYGINAAGQIVGLYVDSNGVSHGFLLDKGAFTTIDVDVKGATDTQATGINNRGQIVGFYFDDDGNSHGFVAQ